MMPKWAVIENIVTLSAIVAIFTACLYFGSPYIALFSLFLLSNLNHPVE